MTYFPALVLGFGLTLTALPAQAGSIITTGGTLESRGKITLVDPATISIDSGGSSPDQIKLSDVIEADFSDTNFHVDYFSSDDFQGNALPSDWQTKDLAPVDIPGSCSYANGEITLKGVGCDLAGEDDLFFFAGRPWKGSGQWTIHMKDFDPNVANTEVGIMIRNSLDRGTIMASAGQMANGGGWEVGRETPDHHSGWEDLADSDPAAWLRVTRMGHSFTAEISPDGVKWSSIHQNDTSVSDNCWVGLFVNSRQDKTVGTAKVDHVTFEPFAPFPQTISPGVELVDGSYLSGYFQYLNPQGGQFTRNSKLGATMTADKVATIVFHPTTADQMKDAGVKAGILMKNGDFLESDFQNNQGGQIDAVSTALGPVTYYSDSMRACILRPVSRRAAAYEVRLNDGSILNASGFDKDEHGITVHTAAGVDVPITADEIAEIRSGTIHAQPLIRLPWTTSVAAAAKPSSEGTATVATWAGNNQEQMLAAPVGTTVSFPVEGKFGAAALRLAVGPGTSTGTKVNVHVLADGRPIPGDLVLTAGDQPRLMKINLNKTQKLSLVADSSDAKARILLIDPVALK
jgi:hypothetical protein